MVAIEDIRARARTLLESGEVRAVLGYQRGSAGTLAEPAFLTEPQQAASLVWDPTCIHNLALYLVNEKKRQRTQRSNDKRPLAVVAKGCDSRALVVLLQENHIDRSEVVILGVSCEGGGVIDPRKLTRALAGRAATTVAMDGADAIRVGTASGETTLPASELLADRCLECARAYPELYDTLYGDKAEGRSYSPRFAALNTVAEKPLDERRAYWNAHFERCIRCYACRAVCPMCYCDECVVDSTEFVVTPNTSADEKANRIRWIQRSPDASESAMYHLVRAMHLAGRCIDCAECERVCPVNIPVRLLNNVLEREALEAFEYVPGTDPGLPSLISSFRDGDPNDFVR
ncbi:MAG: 4Fe-4S dicluster domain-containing protein [Betaproteobacteria bacterium]|nr:4Fe-4S dicluster domain-containing protein [Betaproteobacteria bacterium]